MADELRLWQVIRRALVPAIVLGVLLCIPQVNSLLAGGHYSLLGTIFFPVAFIWAVVTFVSTWRHASLDDENRVWTMILVGGVAYMALAAAFSATSVFLGPPEGLTGLPWGEQFRYLFGLFFSPLSWFFYV